MFGCKPELFTWAFHLPVSCLPPVIKMPGQADMSAITSTSNMEKKNRNRHYIGTEFREAEGSYIL